MSALRLSFGLFTVFPVGHVTPSGRQVRRALLMAPIPGLVIATVAAAALFLVRAALDGDLVGSLATDPLGALMAAALAMLIVEVLGGGLHLDGLTDTVDAMAARGDRDRALAVMKDSAAGPMGVFALVMYVVLTVTALAVAVTRGHGTEALVTGVLAGRIAMIWGCTQRAARQDGLGAWVGRAVGAPAALGVTAATLIIPVALGVLDDDARTWSPVLVAFALPLGVVVAWLTTAPIRRRIGGITGDVLGAMAQVATVAALLVSAVVP